MVLKPVLESPRELLYAGCWSTPRPPRDANSLGLGRNLRIFIFNKFQCDVELWAWGITLWEILVQNSIFQHILSRSKRWFIKTCPVSLQMLCYNHPLRIHSDLWHMKDSLRSCLKMASLTSLPVFPKFTWLQKQLYLSFEGHLCSIVHNLKSTLWDKELRKCKVFNVMAESTGL